MKELFADNVTVHKEQQLADNMGVYLISSVSMSYFSKTRARLRAVTNYSVYFIDNDSGQTVAVIGHLTSKARANKEFKIMLAEVTQPIKGTLVPVGA